jgi:hypothetical protein
VDAKIEVQRQWLKVPEDLLFLLTIQVEKPLVIQLRMNGSDTLFSLCLDRKGTFIELLLKRKIH